MGSGDESANRDVLCGPPHPHELRNAPTFTCSHLLSPVVAARSGHSGSTRDLRSSISMHRTCITRGLPAHGWTSQTHHGCSMIENFMASSLGWLQRSSRSPEAVTVQ